MDRQEDVAVDPADVCKVLEELLNEGGTAFAKRDFVEAERIYDQCRKLMHSFPARVPQSVKDSYKSTVYFELGRSMMSQSWSKCDDFKHYFRQALNCSSSGTRVTAGKARICFRLGKCIYLEGQAQYMHEAESFLQTAMSAFRRLHGPKSRALASVHTALGLVHLDQDRIKDAASQLTLAGEILDSALLDKRNPCFAEYKRTLGLLRMKEKYYSEAARQLSASLTVYSGLFKEDHPMISIVQMSLGTCLYRSGKIADAHLMLTTAFDVYDKTVHNPAPRFQSIAESAKTVMEKCPRHRIQWGEDGSIDVCPRDRDLHAVSLRIAGEWERVAAYLLFNSGDYKRIRRENHLDMYAQSQAMLDEWKETNGKKATISCVVEALLGAGRKMTAEKVFGEQVVTLVEKEIQKRTQNRSPELI
ncbi:uncharacterized protein [Oscarella lobularis]|uniref:uncharacterized protein n=1 Tax=Oscarella lobularis TaxID=121494 RepID=UPI0033142188